MNAPLESREGKEWELYCEPDAIKRSADDWLGNCYRSESGTKEPNKPFLSFTKSDWSLICHFKDAWSVYQKSFESPFYEKADWKTTPKYTAIYRFITESIEQQEKDKELEEIFVGLAKIWKDATGGSSSIRRRFAHPAYRAILRLGPETVPFIIKELKERPDWWFDALEFLTDENPTEPTNSFAEASAAWINWWNNKP